MLKTWLACHLRSWVSCVAEGGCHAILCDGLQTNSDNTGTCCIYLNQTRDRDKYASKHFPSNIPQPTNLVFIMNVYQRNGKAVVSDNGALGNHWSFCHVDIQKKLVTYADSSSLQPPVNLESIIAEFCMAIFGQSLAEFSFRNCHNHNVRSSVCGSMCAMHYLLQRCGDVCGVTTIVCASIAVFDKQYFDHIKSTKMSGHRQVLLKMPTKYNKYLPLVFASWIADQINLNYVFANQNSTTTKQGASLTSKQGVPNITTKQVTPPTTAKKLLHLQSQKSLLHQQPLILSQKKWQKKSMFVHSVHFYQPNSSIWTDTSNASTKEQWTIQWWWPPPGKLYMLVMWSALLNDTRSDETPTRQT